MNQEIDFEFDKRALALEFSISYLSSRFSLAQPKDVTDIADIFLQWLNVDR